MAQSPPILGKLERLRAQRRAATTRWRLNHPEQWQEIHRSGSKRWQKANRERNLATKKRWKDANKEKVAAARQRYRESHREQLRAAGRVYSRATRVKFSEYQRNWRRKNRANCVQYSRKWRLADKPRFNACYARWIRNNPSAKIARSLRTAVRDALKGTKVRASALQLLGCSVGELKIHLVRRFQLGMTMFNHGLVWHIDHIKPVSGFDLTDLAQRQACFHYSNLMPLFAMQNVLKGAK